MKKLNNKLDSIAKPFMGVAPWLLRLGLGISFILHGLQKFPLPPEGMVRWFESLGIIWPELITSLVALGEVFAGLAIIVGGLLVNRGHLVTRIGGGAVAVIMIGAIYLAHSQWFADFLTPFEEDGVTRPGYKHFVYSEQMYLLILGTYFAIKGNK